MVVEKAADRNVDNLIDMINQKLRENRSVLVKSVRFGRLTWRTTKEGQVEIDLEPKL